MALLFWFLSVAVYSRSLYLSGDLWIRYHLFSIGRYPIRENGKSPPISGKINISFLTSVNKKYLSYKLSRTELIRAMMGEGVFYNTNRLLELKEERRDRQKNRDDVNDAKIKELVADLDRNGRRLNLRAKNKGARMNLWGNKVTGTVLAATELCYLYVHIMMLPPFFPHQNSEQIRWL